MSKQVRISDEAHFNLLAMAKRNHRSLGQQLEVFIEQGLKQDINDSWVGPNSIDTTPDPTETEIEYDKPPKNLYGKPIPVSLGNTESPKPRMAKNTAVKRDYSSMLKGKGKK